MLARIAIAASFAALVAAIPTGSKQCQTSQQQCCNSVQKAGDKAPAALLGLLNIVADVDAQIGITCSPITVIGIAGACSQSQQPVCCNDNSYNGVVAIGCTPINL